MSMDDGIVTQAAAYEERLSLSRSQDREQIDCSVRVVTPENIAFLYEVAGPFRRLPAFLIDLGIRLGLAVGAVFVCGLVGLVVGAAAFGPLLLFWFVIEWFYGGLFETFWNGQTPGKRISRIRVLSIDGKPINGLQAVLRNILRAVDLMPVVPAVALGLPAGSFGLPTLVVGLVTPALNRRYQRMGDLVCGTMVVVERRDHLTGIAQLEDPRAAKLAAWIPAHFQIDQKLSRALSVYVERRRTLPEARRREIASRVAQPLIEQFHLAADTSHDLLLCALYHRAYVADHGDRDLRADAGGQERGSTVESLAAAGSPAGELAGTGAALPADGEARPR